MKLGLLHVVGVRKATARKQPAYLSYEHKSLQEFGASKFVTKRLETSENIKVSLSDNNPTCTYPESEDSSLLFLNQCRFTIFRTRLDSTSQW